MSDSNTLSPNSFSPDRYQRRRGSSVGKIDLGDTSPSLATMETSKSQRRRSHARMSALSNEGNSDFVVLSKFVISFNELCYRQTWIIPFLVLVASFSAYYLSGPTSQVHLILESLVKPSYLIPNTDQYGKGVNDFYFVGFYAIFFTFLREFLMCAVLKPLAIWFGIKKAGKQHRFMEQTYSMFYYGLSGPFGLWIMSKLPIWYFNTTEFYTSYPHKTHDWYFKVYYLGQAAFWVQQSVVLILQLEKPRKDFKELVLHHIVTIALIWCSYRFHFTWIGIAIYVTMDVSDFFLATSKTLNYLDSPITGGFFAIFVFVWIYLRHYLNLKILWSVATEFRTVGVWELNWDTQQYKCWISQPITFFLIGALQLVNIYWLWLIFRILHRYIFVGETKDERSDSESEDEEEERKKNQ